VLATAALKWLAALSGGAGIVLSVLSAGIARFFLREKAWRFREKRATLRIRLRDSSIEINLTNPDDAADLIADLHLGAESDIKGGTQAES
jgi:uncharacterized protein YjbK